MTIDELQERFNELRGKKWKGKYYDGEVVFTGFDYVGENSKIKFRIGDDTYTVYANRFYESNLIEEVTPYADWPIDAKILVWDEGETKAKRHFAGITPEGNPKAWNDGATSWTTNIWSSWDHAEFAED